MVRTIIVYLMIVVPLFMLFGSEEASTSLPEFLTLLYNSFVAGVLTLVVTSTIIGVVAGLCSFQDSHMNLSGMFTWIKALKRDPYVHIMDEFVDETEALKETFVRDLFS